MTTWSAILALLSAILALCKGSKSEHELRISEVFCWKIGKVRLNESLGQQNISNRFTQTSFFTFLSDKNIRQNSVTSSTITCAFGLDNNSFLYSLQNMEGSKDEGVNKDDKDEKEYSLLKDLLVEGLSHGVRIPRPRHVKGHRGEQKGQNGRMEMGLEDSVKLLKYFEGTFYTVHIYLFNSGMIVDEVKKQ